MPKSYWNGKGIMILTFSKICSLCQYPTIGDNTKNPFKLLLRPTLKEGAGSNFLGTNLD